MKLNQVTVGCVDYDRSVAFYRRLGLTQIVDSPPRYARFETLRERPSRSTRSRRSVRRQP
ncbi:VOC family protein [Sphingopyxis sp. BSNA05]|uniref:VOC family protein n=1 Tax=Sphingopyxis sp. BSNA05 TaxID=1236614 RepID=UPI0020B65260|nr:VOC family protein [Sphingopyxis sp. BSNA05]